MQNPDEKGSYVSLAIFLIICFLVVQAVIWVISQKTFIYGYCRQLDSFISTNQTSLETALTTSFDRASKCSNEECKKKARQELLTTFQESEKMRFYPSSYPIRLNADGNIEKWLWTGEVVTTIPTTRSEKRVAALLAGVGSPICTQGWKIDGTETSMRYLKDFHSEAEIIKPIKKDGKIIGAWVVLYGD